MTGPNCMCRAENIGMHNTSTATHASTHWHQISLVRVARSQDTLFRSHSMCLIRNERSNNNDIERDRDEEKKNGKISDFYTLRKTEFEIPVSLLTNWSRWWFEQGWRMRARTTRPILIYMLRFIFFRGRIYIHYIYVSYERISDEKNDLQQNYAYFRISLKRICNHVWYT